MNKLIATVAALAFSVFGVGCAQTPADQPFSESILAKSATLLLVESARGSTRGSDNLTDEERERCFRAGDCISVATVSHRNLNPDFAQSRKAYAEWVSNANAPLTSRLNEWMEADTELATDSQQNISIMFTQPVDDALDLMPLQPAEVRTSE